MALIFTVMAVIQSIVESTYCPAKCTCVFDNTLDNNAASCNITDTKVNIKWRQKHDEPILSISCEPWIDAKSPSNVFQLFGIIKKKNFVQSLVNMVSVANYSCEDLPKFDISHFHAKVEVTTCAPNIIRCVHSIYKQPTFIDNLESHFMQEYYTKDDLKNLNKVSSVRIFLRVADTAMPVVAIESLPAIKELYIIGGHIHFSKQEYNETPLENLEMYDNKMDDIPTDAFKGLNKLKKILITNNSISHLSDGAFNGLDSLDELNLQGNMVKYLGIDANTSSSVPKSKDLRKSSELFQNAPSLRVINLSENQINVIPEHMFSMMEKLENVYLSYNNIENLSSNLFEKSFQLKEIHLDHNAIDNIDLNMFNDTRLRNLNLAYNKLQRLFGDIGVNRQIKLLNLSNNSLEVFEDWFMDLTDLEYLDLSGNNITMIKEYQMNFTNSRLTIDLRQNNISQIIRNTHQDMILTMGNISLYLSDNPIQCNCPVITILHEWYKRGVLLDYEEIICEDETQLSNINMDINCNEGHALIGSIGSSLVGGLIIIIILVTIFKRRKKIWQYLLTFLNHKTDKKENSFEMTDQSKTYDIFISFTCHVEEFVYNELLPKLEGEYSQRVYLRTFVGEIFPDQEKESIENASVAMIILTELFLVSDRMNLEFTTIYNLNKQKEKPKIIFILLDDTILRHENLHEDIKSCIATNSYLLWNDTNFWKKLLIKLPRSTNSN